ncbi:Uncharacterised protein g10897 [Pycnogonum litorale]
MFDEKTLQLNRRKYCKFGIGKVMIVDILKCVYVVIALMTSLLWRVSTSVAEVSAGSTSCSPNSCSVSGVSNGLHFVIASCYQPIDAACVESGENTNLKLIESSDKFPFFYGTEEAVPRRFIDGIKYTFLSFVFPSLSVLAEKSVLFGVQLDPLPSSESSLNRNSSCLLLKASFPKFLVTRTNVVGKLNLDCFHKLDQLSYRVVTFLVKVPDNIIIHKEATIISFNTKVPPSQTVAINVESSTYVIHHKYYSNEHRLLVKFRVSDDSLNRTLSIYLLKKQSLLDECDGTGTVYKNVSFQAGLKPRKEMSLYQVMPGLYCIQIVTECRNNNNGCKSIFSSKPFPLITHTIKGLSSPFGDIIDWSLNYTVQQIDSGGMLHLTFDPYLLQPYGFHKLRIKLMTGNMTVCDGYQSHQELVKQTIVDTNQPYVTFTKLTPGYYCFRVFPTNEICSQLECPPKFTKVYHLKAPDDNVSPIISYITKPSVVTTHVSATIIVVIVVICFCIMMCIPFSIYRWVQKVKRQASAFGRLEEQSLPIMMPSVDHSRPQVAVLFIYTEDCDLHIEVINSLASLLSSLGCEVIVPSSIEHLADIQSDPIHWFRSMINEKDLSGMNLKILWIASDMACLRYEAVSKFSNIADYGRDGIDSYYEVCVRMLSERIFTTRSENPYREIAIAYLPYNKMSTIINGVMSNRRYELPRMLSGLYRFLHGYDYKVPSYLETKYQHRSTNPYVVSFLKAVKNMEMFVKDNPNL